MKHILDINNIINFFVIIKIDYYYEIFNIIRIKINKIDI